MISSNAVALENTAFADSLMSLLNKRVYLMNKFTETRRSMTVHQMRLLSLALSKLSKSFPAWGKKEAFGKMTWITPTEIINLFGGDRWHYIKMRESVIDGSTPCLEVAEDGGEESEKKRIPIYDSMGYEPYKGIYLRFSPEIVPYISARGACNYTSYSLRDMFYLTSPYSWRLMELMLRYQSFFAKGKRCYQRAFTVEQIRDLFGFPEDKKAPNSAILKNCITVPIREINRKTHYVMACTLVTRGKTRVVGVHVWIRRKKSSEAVYVPPYVQRRMVRENDACPFDEMDFDTSNNGDAPQNESVIRQERAKLAKEESKAVLHTPQNQGTQQIGKKELTAAMKREHLTMGAINTWLKERGVESTQKCFDLTIMRANKKGLQGKDREKYIQSCMERDIFSRNESERELKERLDREEAERQLQKQCYESDAHNFFATLQKKMSAQNQNTTNEAPRGRDGDMTPIGNTLAKMGLTQQNEVKPITKEQAESLASMLETLGGVTDAVDEKARDLGYNSFRALAVNPSNFRVFLSLGISLPDNTFSR